MVLNRKERYKWCRSISSLHSLIFILLFRIASFQFIHIINYYLQEFLLEGSCGYLFTQDFLTTEIEWFIKGARQDSCLTDADLFI